MDPRIHPQKFPTTLLKCPCIDVISISDIDNYSAFAIYRTFSLHNCSASELLVSYQIMVLPDN